MAPKSTQMHLRIVVADDEASMLRAYGEFLPMLGHQVVGSVTCGRDLVDKTLAEEPDLVISDIRMPDMDGIKAAGLIYSKLKVPIILVSGYYDPELVKRASEEHILGYAVKPLTPEILRIQIMLAMQRFGERQKLEDQAEHFKQLLVERKTVERAKGIVMKKTSLSEPDAYKKLQKLASVQNKKLIEIAHVIIAADEMENMLQ